MNDDLRATRTTVSRRGLAVGGTILVAVALPWVLMPYSVFQVSTVMAYAVAMLAVTLLTGYTGAISLGQSMFFAIGAYAYAVLTNETGLPFVAIVAFVFVACFAIGYLLSVPVQHLSPIHFAIVTLGLAVLTPPLISRFGGVTGGAQGLIIEKRSAPSWLPVAADQFTYYMCLITLVLVALVTWNLTRGRTGRSLNALRDHPVAATSMGVHVAGAKRSAFAYSTGFTAIGGILYALVVGLVAPTTFTLQLALYLLVGAFVGGIRHISGAIIGAFFITYVPDYASAVNQALGGAIFGVALIAVILLVPGGVASLPRLVRDRVGRSPAPCLTASHDSPSVVSPSERIAR